MRRAEVRASRCHVASSEAPSRGYARCRRHTDWNDAFAPGHSTLDITREIYLHAIPEEQRRAVESVERLVFGPKFNSRRGSIRNSALKKQE